MMERLEACMCIHLDKLGGNLLNQHKPSECLLAPQKSLGGCVHKDAQGHRAVTPSHAEENMRLQMTGITYTR